MSFRWFIYYCTMFGGCAAYMGWMMGRIPPSTTLHHVLLAAIRGMFLGMILALGLTLVDTLWNFTSKDALLAIGRLLVGGFIGSVGGFLGGMLGQILTYKTQLSLFLVFGWTITGLLIGMSPGMFDLLMRLARNEQAGSARRKVIHGLLGGGVGGLLGGVFYLMLRAIWQVLLGDRADESWTPSATGFIILGMCIGLFIGLAQVILSEAWVRVEAGFRSGRELILSNDDTTIGRGEGCTIALFGDSGVEKMHARITFDRGRYFIEDVNTPGGTFLNGQRVTRPLPLRAGDLIEMGRSSLRFGERQKRPKDE
jgi:hypothetical protein